MIETGCGCCGRDALRPGDMSDCITTHSNGAIRCSDHHGRNPCAIPGCRRTRAAPIHNGFPVHDDDQTLCPEHWRRFVPPRSRIRRAYHAHFRRAKRIGWTDRNRRAFWSFWNRLVRTARRRASEGHIDEAEINRLMGWD